MIFIFNNTLIFAKRNHIFPEINRKKNRPTMGILVTVGLGELQPLFGAREQFIGRLWNAFFRF